MGELNFLPLEFKELHKKRRNKLIAIGIFLGFLAIVAIAIAVPKILIFTLQNKESALKDKIQVESYITADNVTLNKKIKDYNEYFSLIDAITAQNGKVTTRLNDISKLLPVDVTVTALTINKDTISITVSSGEYTDICCFAAYLESSRNYQKVQLSGITSDNGKPVKYTGVISIVK